MAPAAATQLPNLWDDAHAASLDEPGLLLHRSNSLGGDLRIANFGGGNASAYRAAKSLELHLARCLALEGGAFGIRVNSVNPDAALRGSKIWQGEWRDQRAQSNEATVDELEEVYRQRSLLKLSVYPEDVAEAGCFLASDVASKSTGDIINVDAGNAVSFTRQEAQRFSSQLGNEPWPP
jgi:NAD(P)-dependent dehydrogenase (short-subunit alcohol dehydrogenase family)